MRGSIRSSVAVLALALMAVAAAPPARPKETAIAPAVTVAMQSHDSVMVSAPVAAPLPLVVRIANAVDSLSAPKADSTPPPSGRTAVLACAIVTVADSTLERMRGSATLNTSRDSMIGSRSSTLRPTARSAVQRVDPGWRS
jgi:hypothetical protein